MTEHRQMELDSPNPRVRIQCKGDLRVEGWEQPLIELDAQGDAPILERHDDRVKIEADSACTIRLPETSESVEITAGGQAKVSGLRGALHLIQVKGDLLLNGGGSVKIGKLGGKANLMNVAGDVQVQKRARGDLSAQGIRGAISVAGVAGRLTLEDVSAAQVRRVRGDLIVRNAVAGIVVGKVDGNVRLDNVAAAARLEKALGDASFRGVRGSVACGQVTGQLHLVDVEEVTVGQVLGDLSAEAVKGALACQKAYGRAKLGNVDGSISLGGVGGDLVVEACGGMLSANCGGRAALSGIAGHVRVNADGDVRCSLPESGGASVKAVCGGSLTVAGGDETVRRDQGAHIFTVGDGQNGYALVAGGAIHLQTAESVSISPAIDEKIRSDFRQLDEGLRELDKDEFDADLGAMGAQIAATVGHRISHTLQNKLKRKLRAIGRRAAAGEWTDARSWNIERNRKPHPRHNVFAEVEVEAEAEPADAAVSYEERMMILRMLEEGKISAAEAEQLLDALGSRAGDS